MDRRCAGGKKEITMKFKNIGTEQLIVNGGIVHPGAEVECEKDPKIDGLVPLSLQTAARAVVSEAGRKVGAERVDPDKERETDPLPEEDDDAFGGGA